MEEIGDEAEAIFDRADRGGVEAGELGYSGRGSDPYSSAEGRLVK